MDLGVKGKGYVIGGASKGLGRAIAGVLAAEGASLLLMARDEAILQELSAELGPNASYLVADMADPATPGKVAAAAAEKLPSLDGVLMNAGGPPAGKVFDLTDDQWLSAYQLLIGGPIRLLRELTPKMAPGASVLFVTSSSVRQPIPNLDTSNIMRPGVAALVKVLARQLAPDVRVNAVAPGRFSTDRITTLDEAKAKATGQPLEQVQAEALAAIPFGRYGDPVEMGRAAAFLLSPAASYVSGVVLQVDGAMVNALP